MLGIGVNVSNANPTMCINDAIRLHNAHTHTADDNKVSSAPLALLSPDHLIARAIGEIERLVEMFQKETSSAKGGGMETFLELYYERWIHG